MNELNTSQEMPPRKKGDNKRNLLILGAALIVALLAGWLVFSTVKANKRANRVQLQMEQLQLEFAQNQLEREYQDLNDEFQQFENSRKYIKDDSIKRELNDKYEAARIQVEKLQQELANQKNKSAAEIAKLRGEIDTLRALLRHYVEEIDRLNKENEALRTENKEIKEQNTRLSSQVTETKRANEVLNERMTLAEKLNVTGLNITALNKKGKNEKKVEKAVQLMVSFTIPQNNSTPVGEKTIYLRIMSPSGQLLTYGGTFSFEGGSVEYTAKKTIEYAGEEIGGVTIYYDVNTPLIAGDYTVELFADNYRLISRHFNLK
ncbi:MAG: hypothetical protein J1F05_00895 [Muribaculaceae bacterium]|nr:hypothetical protein [Muribaculaceae bacterium]